VFKITEYKQTILHDVDTLEREVKTKMVHISVIEARLAKLGFKASMWFKPEIRELPHILMDNEQIVGAVAGRYFGGFALLVATDRRILLIDKKLPYISVEDIRYDMISEIDYSSQIFDATITIFTVNKQHRFNSWKHKHHLRKLTQYAQQRVMEVRQYQSSSAQPQDIIQTVKGPSLAQAYNYNQLLQLQPPWLPQNARKRLPSPHLPRIVGAAAVRGARSWMPPNPYAGGSLVSRRQWRSSYNS
jgi:hypothetical protein